MYLEQDDKILFLGGINKQDPKKEHNIGLGYTLITAAALSAKFPDLNLSFINQAYCKDNSQDMMLSLKERCLSERPSVVVVFLGYQDAVLAREHQEQASLKEYSRFNRTFRKLIEEIQTQATRCIILLEPFLLDVNNVNRSIRQDIDQKIQITREIAKDYRCDFLSLDGTLNELAIKNGTFPYVEEDGINYKLATHHIIAEKLINHFKY